MEKKCTVLMPVYNKEEYIEQAIQSVLDQETDYLIELVIADDCSVDRSVAIAEEFCLQNPEKIRVLRSDKNRGLLSNDIRVFQNMKTEYFCVLDPDDYWIDKRFLQKGISFLETNKEYVCYSSNTVVLEENKQPIAYISTKESQKVTASIEDYFNGRAVVPHTTAAIYRNVIFKNGVPKIIYDAVGTISEASYRGDHDRFVMHLKYGKAIFVNEYVGVYRITKSGIWSGASQIHRDLLAAQAKFDYSAFYNHLYQRQFKNMAIPYYTRAREERERMLKRGESLEKGDERLFQEVKKEMEDGCDVTSIEVEARIKRMEGLIFQGLGVQKEILWANIFHDTIRGSEWLPENISFSPGRWALGYPGLYLLYRALNEMRPSAILELGLGQSTQITGSYVKYQTQCGNMCRHYVVEDNQNWIRFFCHNNSIPEATEIIRLDMKEMEFDINIIGKTKINMYNGFKERLEGEKFDLIFIDAPWGSEEYSRIDVANILPGCLTDRFMIIMDDCNRKGELRTVRLMQDILNESGIAYCQGIYEGEKATVCLVSPDLEFMCSM